MLKLFETFACVPSTERGRGILISGDPKSDSILYCNGRSVLIRSLRRPQDVEVYGEHGYPVTVARYSPNGEWIASADVSGTVRIWGTHNGFVLKNEFRVLAGRIDDLQWSSDGLRIVASGDAKGKSFVRAFVWDSGNTVGDFDGHSRRVLSCAFKPTRPFRIATCGEDFLVNFYDGPPFKFHSSHREHSNFVNCIRFSPDGSKFITVSSDKKGMIYDGKTGEKMGELAAEDGHKGSIYAVSWSPDGKQVLTVSADKTAKVWDISEDGTVGSLVKTLISSGSSGGAQNMLVGCLWQNENLITVSLCGTICLFSGDDLEKPPLQLSGHIKNVTALAVIGANPKTILSSSYDGLIVKWLQGVGYISKLQMKDGTKIKRLVANENFIILSGFDNKVWRIPLEGDEFGEADHIDIGHQPLDVSIAANSAESTVLVSYGSGVVLVNGVSILSKTELGFPVAAAEISADGREAIVGGEDGKLHIYSISGENLKEEAVVEKHRGAVTVIRYSPDFSMFASGDANREAVVWDRQTKQVKLNNMLFHTARINCLAWSPDSKMVATGSIDTCLIVYQVDKPASSRLTVRNAHLGGVNAVAFIDHSTLASSGEDASVRSWLIHDPL